MSRKEVNDALTRLLTLLGVDKPKDGRLEFVFRGGNIVQVRPNPYIDVLASDEKSAHTHQP